MTATIPHGVAEDDDGGIVKSGEQREPRIWVVSCFMILEETSCWIRLNWAGPARQPGAGGQLNGVDLGHGWASCSLASSISASD